MAVERVHCIFQTKSVHNSWTFHWNVGCWADGWQPLNMLLVLHYSQHNFQLMLWNQLRHGLRTSFSFSNKKRACRFAQKENVHHKLLFFRVLPSWLFGSRCSSRFMFFDDANQTSITSPAFDHPILWLIHSKTEKMMTTLPCWNPRLTPRQSCSFSSKNALNFRSHWVTNMPAVNTRGFGTFLGNQRNSWELGKGRCASMDGMSKFILILFGMHKIHDL